MSESLRDALTEMVFSCRVLAQAREATVSEIDGFIAGPLQAALSQARADALAQGRREGLEEAADAVEREAGQHKPDVATTFRIYAAHFRRRATAPAETQKPEETA